MTSEGTVREWREGEGWGVIDSAATPGGCWAHFSAIEAQGYRSLEPGSQVRFTYEAPARTGSATGQCGCGRRARAGRALERHADIGGLGGTPGQAGRRIAYRSARVAKPM